MYSSVTSCAMVGADPTPVHIETTVTGGHHGFVVVGLPDTAVRESRERVRAAIRHQGFSFPTGRVVVNLQPADVPKVGATYDLPIALSILAAALEQPLDFDGFVAVGELTLNGDVRPVRAALGAVEIATRTGRRCMLSDQTRLGRHEAEVVAGIGTLGEAVGVARGTRACRSLSAQALDIGSVPDLADVRGQGTARRALEIAAAGGHHLLMSGAPGSGKTMLARRLPSILPRLSEADEREVALVWSAAGLDRLQPGIPPFRDPHHSASIASLVGGGVGLPRPGEVSRAHKGILFLDELGEFAPAALDALRQPFEDGFVTIARSAGTLRFPADVQIVAATNPCPCGFLRDRRTPCRCSDAQVDRYRTRLSGPLSDRFDLRVTVDRLHPRDLRGAPGESSATVRERVEMARARQAERGVRNRDMAGGDLDAMPASRAAERTMDRMANDDTITGRGWDRIRRVARTIADLDGSGPVEEAHVAEAGALRGGPT